MEIKLIFIIILLSLTFIMMSIEIIGIIIENEKVRKIVKAIPLFLLSISIFIFNYKEFYLISLGFLFYSLGDLFLLSNKRKMLVIGTSSFLSGHILIGIKLFLSYFTFNLFYFLISILLFIIFNSILFIHYYRGLKKYTYGMALYLAFLAFLNIYTIFNIEYNLKFIILFLGFLTYLFSDFYVFKEKFFKKNKNIKLIIMTTYYLANSLIFSFFFFYF